MYVHDNIQIKNKRILRRPGEFLLTAYFYLVRSTDPGSRHFGGWDQLLIRNKLDELNGAGLSDPSLITELTKTVEMISILQRLC